MASRRLTPSPAGRRQAPPGPAGPDAPVIVALTDAGEEGTAPAAEDLFIYAELLGMEADALAARDPLPGVTEIRQVLREVPTAEHALRLSDTDLVLLAAAASREVRRDAPPRAVPEGPARRARGEDLPGRLDRRGRVRRRTGPPRPGPLPRPGRAEPAHPGHHHRAC